MDESAWAERLTIESHVELLELSRADKAAELLPACFAKSDLCNMFDKDQ
jgi:plasmid rolling circle replication initiator protein Rep